MSAAAEWRGQWMSTSDIASQYGRTERTVRKWCSDGTLREFNFLVYRDRLGKWWIRERIADPSSLTSAR